jgi:hypothetical protein
MRVSAGAAKIDEKRAWLLSTEEQNLLELRLCLVLVVVRPMQTIEGQGRPGKTREDEQDI